METPKWWMAEIRKKKKKSGFYQQIGKSSDFIVT